MGYCVQMTLENVEIPKTKEKQALEILNKLNESWLRTNDWCRFNPSENLLDVLEDLGFETEESDSFYKITEFYREKLGDHCNMFKKLAAVLENCQIKFYGEDDVDWKIVIKDHESETIYREDF